MQNPDHGELCATGPAVAVVPPDPGLVAISSGSTLLGLQEFTHLFVVAITPAIGLVVGNLLYKPKICSDMRER